MLVLAGGGWRWSDVIIKYCQGVTLAVHLLLHHPAKLVSWGQGDMILSMTQGSFIIIVHCPILLACIEYSPHSHLPV